MEPWKTALRRGFVGGAASSILSTAALAALGKREAGSAYAPTNAVSHWVYGDEAFAHGEPALKYTVPGYLIHHGSALFWSVLLERFCGRLLDRKRPATTLGIATAASAIACFADYRLTPKRFQPGYEQHLSKPSLAGVYGAFGIGLAIGAMLVRRG